MQKADAAITSRTAVMIYDAYNTGRTNLTISQVRISVMYWQPGIIGRNPALVYATFGMNADDNRLNIGGAQELVTFKNAAIGRRVCPDCYDRGLKVPVEERGAKAGKCKECGTYADYIKTALPPYFFYFSHASPKDIHLGFNSPELSVVDALKSGLGTLPVRDMIWPTRYIAGWVHCDVPAHNRVVVFDRNEMPLHGVYGTTRYDVRAVV